MLGYLALSAINYALFSWLVYILTATGFPANHPGWAALLWLTVILIGPAMLGAALGVVIQKDFFRQFFARLRLQPVHVVPTAWDYQFGRLREAHWVLVELKDGRTVAGFFGTRSFASSDPEERDIFIEQVYRIDEDYSLASDEGWPWYAYCAGRGSIGRLLADAQ